MIHLDYSITNLEERKALVQRILDETPQLTDTYLDILADYLVYLLEKEEKKQKKILTPNRLSTINSHEISFEGLVGKLENGEDGLYNLISDNKHQFLKPKLSITKKDLEEIPELKMTRESMKFWQEKAKHCSGKAKFIAKKAAIDFAKLQYIIKDFYRSPVSFSKITKTDFPTKLEESYELDKDNYVIPKGICLADPKVCSIILCNYSRMKEDGYGKSESDLNYLMKVFDDLCGRALKDFPLLDRIVLYKIDGKSGLEIQKLIKEEFNVTHSLEYISALWRKKIPNLIASAAEDDILDQHFLNNEKGVYKKCNRCGQIKLAHNKYFSKNKTSKDGYYSICKECRNKRSKKKRGDY